MRTYMKGLLKGRTMLWGSVAAILAAGGLALATMNSHHYRWGGAWVGGVPGFVWNCLQIPLDPEGKTEAIRVEPLMWGDDIAGLLYYYADGADYLTGAVGQGQMISQDTGRWTLYAYAQKTSTPPVTTAVVVYSGTWAYTSPDTAVITYTATLYPLSKDGFSPDLAAPKWGPSAPMKNDVKRVPIL